MVDDQEDTGDLLARLKAADSELCAEAADEIEGLSKAIVRLLGERDRLIDQCHRWSLRFEDANLKIRALSALGS